MALVLGLDLSVKKTGFCVLDTQKPFNHFVEMGRLTTSSEDGITAQRLYKQAEQIRELIRRYDIKCIMKEDFVLGQGESELLYALHQFVDVIFLQEQIPEVMTMPPSRLKHLAVPEGSRSGEIGKPQMILAARRQLGLDFNPADDPADAFWLSHFLKQYYQVKYEGAPENSLREDVKKAFFGVKKFQRGVKSGTSVHEGIIFRVNEFYFNFKNLLEKKGLYGWEKRACSKESLPKKSGSKSISRGRKSTSLPPDVE